MDQAPEALKSLSRRDWLKLTSGAAISLSLGGVTAAGQPAPKSSPPPSMPGRKRVLRIGHLTDIHVQPERAAGEGMAVCLRHLQALADPPDLILTGGDSIMDSFEAGEARTRTQWQLWQKLLRDECSLPIEHCIGNHDVWGWDKAASGTTGKEPNYGKKWAMEVMGLERPYRAFDRAGWRFIVLDSIYPKDNAYIGHLDDEQFAWLEQELKRTPADRPILILSHIPILSAAALLFRGPGLDGQREVSPSLMHVDSLLLKDLFARHSNVKLCLSGHLHLVDRVDYNGVTYLCNGAVSGNWWKGRHRDCDEGYALVDLYDDGSFDRQYVLYGWKARA